MNRTAPLVLALLLTAGAGSSALGDEPTGALVMKDVKHDANGLNPQAEPGLDIPTPVGSRPPADFLSLLVSTVRSPQGRPLSTEVRLSFTGAPTAEYEYGVEFQTAACRDTVRATATTTSAQLTAACQGGRDARVTRHVPARVEGHDLVFELPYDFETFRGVAAPGDVLSGFRLYSSSDLSPFWDQAYDFQSRFRAGS